MTALFPEICMRLRVFVCSFPLFFLCARDARAQWMLMGDGVAFVTDNHQGGPRGGDEVKSTNWWMGMASTPTSAGQLTFIGMLSADPLTATSHGYRELFQVGETYKGELIVDRQHPHDLLMQAAAVWRMPIGENAGFTIAGGPVGEPALGPVAFMHRPSAAENPAAPLAHHTLDSTHIAMEVITAAFDRGPLTIESSVFHGAEPDDNRWDLMDPGALDSWSTRVWLRPSKKWEFQASHGFLKKPEALEPDDVRRTTGSASWFGERGNDFTAVTVAYGRNDKHGDAFNAFLAEATDRRGSLSIYGRAESVQNDVHPRAVGEFTVGAVHELPPWTDFEVGVGADVTFYAVPAVLRDAYGSHPISFHVFLRVRPPKSRMGRMWNMRMADP
jgi:hypothetical protein